MTELPANHENSVRNNITSDIANLPKEVNPSKEALKQSIREMDEFETTNPTLETEIGPIDWAFYIDPEKPEFNPGQLANEIRSRYSIVTDKDSDIIYFYDGKKGIYRKDGETVLKVIIDKVLGLNNRTHRTTEVIGLVKSKTFSTINPGRKIAVLNGVIEPRNGEFSEAKMTDFIIHQIPVIYDKAATCPFIFKTLNEWLPEDQVEQALELIGYCLLQELPISRSAVLLGDGANGKTSFLNLVCAFLGPRNVSHVTLQQICEGKFELAQLYRKLANICDDLPGDALKSVGNFKNLTGNAPIQAQFKHKDPFDFWNTAKMLWACNRLPAASEDTRAYYRRFLILNFDRVFEGDKKDTNLLQKLTLPQELSGLLNVALEKLKVLLQQQDFSFSKSTEEERQQYIRSADSCQSFIEEMVQVDTTDDNAYIREDDFYSRYIAYCVFHNIQKKRKADLTISMQKNRPEAQRTMIRILKKPTRVWQFIKITENVTGVTDVTGVSPLEKFGTQNYKKEERAVTAVTPVTPGNDLTVNPEEHQLKTVTESSGVRRLEVNENLPQEIVHYQRVNPYIESHKCDGCQGLLAEFKQPISKEDQERIRLSQPTVYLCNDCFVKAKTKGESLGAKFVESPQEEPQYSGEDS